MGAIQAWLMIVVGFIIVVAICIVLIELIYYIVMTVKWFCLKVINSTWSGRIAMLLGTLIVLGIVLALLGDYLAVIGPSVTGMGFRMLIAGSVGLVGQAIWIVISDYIRERSEKNKQSTEHDRKSGMLTKL
jgi:hypothetical protein